MKTKTMKTKTMKTKSLLSLTCAFALLCLGGQANAALTVTNGDFSDLTGLTYMGGPWYSGLPNGWNTDFSDRVYTVKYTGNPSPGVFTYAANLSQLSSTSPNFLSLYQSVGITDYSADVTVKFDLANLNGYGYDVGVAIFQKSNSDPSSNTLLANRSIQDGYPDANGVPQNGVGTFELTAQSVASGSLLQIAFWTTGGAASLTNVSISQVPEPSGFSLLVLGSALTFAVSLRRRRNR